MSVRACRGRIVNEVKMKTVVDKFEESFRLSASLCLFVCFRLYKSIKVLGEGLGEPSGSNASLNV